MSFVDHNKKYFVILFFWILKLKRNILSHINQCSNCCFVLFLWYLVLNCFQRFEFEQVVTGNRRGEKTVWNTPRFYQNLYFMSSRNMQRNMISLISCLLIILQIAMANLSSADAEHIWWNIWIRMSRPSLIPRSRSSMPKLARAVAIAVWRC